MINRTIEKTTTPVKNRISEIEKNINIPEKYLGFKNNFLRIMKLTVNRKKEIKLEKLLYQEYLRKAYIVYNCQHHHVSIKRKTDYTYYQGKKWKIVRIMVRL